MDWVATAQHVKELVDSNQFLGGGLVLGVIASVVAMLRRVPEQIYGWLRRQVVVTAEVISNDDAFGWMQAWMAAQPYSHRKARRWLAQSQRQSSNDDDGLPAPAGTGMAASPGQPDNIRLTPAPGYHLLRYRGTWLWVHYDRERMQNDKMLVGFYETMSISTWRWCKPVLRRVLQDAHDTVLPPEEDKLTVYKRIWGNWRTWDRVRPRRGQQLAFADDRCERVTRDAREFLLSEGWYDKRGIPWRRGYLFYGSPGNGKTSLVEVLAGELRKPVYILPLAVGMTDSQFQDALLEVETGAILLIEDVDVLLSPKREHSDDDKLTLSGLLNGLDGIGGRRGSIVVMTTNHRDALDPALTRPGRADVHLEFLDATPEQARQLFENFYGPLANGLGRRFAERKDVEGRSMAALQEHLLRYRDDPDGAAAKELSL